MSLEFHNNIRFDKSQGGGYNSSSILFLFVMKNFTKAFTLIELLIVIVIIGILAVALIPRLTGLQARARDTVRMADLKQIQTALEFYASENNGQYPTTSNQRFSVCIWFNPGGIPRDITWLSGYIPWLAPEYINSLPVDPKPIDLSGCYLYRSNGLDYMFQVNRTVEWKILPEYIRPAFPTFKSFAIYTSWARMW